MKSDRIKANQRRGLPTLCLVAVVLLALAGLLQPRAAHAATITVANGEVAINDNGLCSLREAIDNANFDFALYDDCAAGSGADIVSLPANGSFAITNSYTYFFGNTGLPVVISTITIEGNGSTIDRDSGTNFRLLVVNGAPGANGNLTLNDLTLTDGALPSDTGGGAVLNNLATLTINDSTLSGHSGTNSQGGGAIHANGGTTTINNSTLHSNQAGNSGGGGGIYANNSATVNVTDSTIRNNTAANTSGGGIRLNFTGTNVLNLTGSTVNNNSANGGGGIAHGSGSATITNSTISANTSQNNGGGIDAASATFNLNNVTVTGNTAGAGGGGGGGGVYSNATLNLNRSVISGNFGPTGYDSGYELVGNGTENANNYNVFGRSDITNNRAFAFSFTPGASDVTATSNGTQPTALASILNTSLGNNGGPTNTHALVAGSPAVDRAPSAACTPAPVDGIDQRGLPRNVDGNASAGANECDTGAYEYLSGLVPPSGTIIIVKAATPEDNTSFSFTENIANTGFTLMDPSDNSETFNGVPIGSYTVTETVPTGWTLDNIVCNDPDNGSTTAGSTATIDLDDDETITCTFNNSLDTGTIRIVKQATPEDDTSFLFNDDIGPSAFSLSDPSNTDRVYSNVPVGSYYVQEGTLAGWTLDDIDCVDPTNDSSGDEPNRRANIELADGETVTCTFSNSLDTGTIIIEKVASPADDTSFTFTEDISSLGFTLMDPSDDSITFSDVTTGSYTVTEDAAPDWTLDSIVCDDANSTGDTGTRTASIALEDGETVTCTFSNVELVADIYISPEDAGTTDDNLAYGPHDVLAWDGSAWSKWFDGSAAGLRPNGNAKHNINSLWIPDTGDDDVVMSFAQDARFVDGISGKVDGMDLVWWDGDSFSLWLDGQDIGLTVLTKEKIDGLHVLDGSEAPPALAAAAGGSCDSYLLISTAGDGQVPNYSGGNIKFDGTDVLGFCMTQSGATTQGKWIRVLNGKAEGMPGQALINLSASDDGQTLYLTTRATFNVDSATGIHSMVYRYDFATGEFSGPFFSAPANGMNNRVDGLQVDGNLP